MSHAEGLDAGDLAIQRALRVLEEQRAIHPELRRRLTWNGARAILRRLRIKVVSVPMLCPAALISQYGVSVLLLDADTPPRRHTYFVAHELAHLWLHVGADRSPVFYMTPCWDDDEREDDAELLATLMMQGPRFSRPF